MTEKTVQQIYQKKTPLEHVLLRPDTYVGSIQCEKSYKWILPPQAKQFEYKQITFVPALYKIFDEVLVNAADNYQRQHNMNLLKVEIDAERGYISVHNNGKGIPISIHKQEKIYVPQLIFGHLLTGSNYNDDQKKVVGGRNGYGAKLANIFSLNFIVECADGKKGKKFKMQWKKNMTLHNQPQITSYSGKDYTLVKFYPDFKRFNMTKFDEDIIGLLTKRVYDMAGLMPRVKCYFNDKLIEISSFLDYVNMYYDPQSSVPKIFDKNVDTDRWQVVVSISQGQFRQVSFVNSICTTKGGTHVNYITDQIVQKIQQKIKKKDKSLNVKPFQIKAHLWIFVNALIQNPAFDSQTKQTLTLKASSFGSKCQLSQKMIKQILKSGVVDDIFNEAKAKQLNKLVKVTAGTKKARITGIPKLEDANEAGTKNSQRCVLILTQGDSAKGTAMSGLQVIGRDFYGVFPLKGKLLNVRQANNKTLMNNEQIQNVIKILGLQINKSYDDLKSLRYGSIMIMADQDNDGSHIKGLVINFIHYFWPSLFRATGFLKQFVTPILKAMKGRQILSFYTLKDYKAWAQTQQNIKLWRVKYYKGLGTSSDKEAQQYFEDLRKHKIDFEYGGNQDDQSIQLCFSRKKIEQRKQWLSLYDPNISMLYDRPKIHYKQFVDKQFIHFSNADNIRSIASIIDGFKPGQRKIIYSCFKRNLKQQIKVAQLAGYVSQHSAYHHGQMSLTQAIVGMAQNFVGSNNINLLMPNGQFGSRNQGGKQHASARYIFTCLNKITRFIFPESDDHTLTYVEDDGSLVQPQYYVPIIPMALINGCQGIGTGWSTYIPNFNPRQISQAIIKKLDNNQDFVNSLPWYKGFIGEIIKKNDISLDVKGIIQADFETNTIHIRQLPVGKWTKDHKETIDEMMTQNNSFIVSLREHHTKSKVHFELEVTQQWMNKHGNDLGYLQKTFKTSTTISLNNMVGFDNHKMLHRYGGFVDIMNQYYHIRLQFYKKRKQYLKSKLVREVAILGMKQRFIVEIVEETLNIRNIKKIQICELLKKKGYKRFSQFPKVITTKKHKESKTKKDDQNEGSEEEDQATNKKQLSTQYNYLLSLPLWSLTYEKVQEIKEKTKQKQTQLKILDATKLEQMWKQDIHDFLKVLDEVEKQEEIYRDQLNKKVKGGKRNKAKAAKKNEPKKQKNQKQKVKQINWDSDSQDRSTQKVTNSKNTKQQIKKSSNKKKQQKKKPKQKQTSPNDDLISRMKKKMEKKQSDSDNCATDFAYITKPQQRLRGFQDFEKSDDKYQIVKVPRKTKKATLMDSDESDVSINEDSQFEAEQ